MAKLTTDENGYAKSGELEAGSYTVKELTASKGYIVDVTAHNVTVEPEKTAAVTVTGVPQSNPMDLLLQKLDKERKKAEPQGSASLAEAQFTVKFYTGQSDTDPAAGGAKPARTWIFKTDAEGKAHFSKNYLVSGDAFYTQTDGKTPCLPLGTVTVQETKAPVGYLVNDTVFVQKITAGGAKETVSCYNASSVEEQIYRGGVKVQKRDLETKKEEPQGGASLEGAVFTITSLNDHPVMVEGKAYTKNQVVMSLTTDSKGTAATKKDALPFGHYRIDETKAPEGYLNGGQPEKQEEPEEKLPEIDFEGLRAINGDVVAWIQIPGIGVDYPVVQGKDNEHYLHYTFDGKTNKEGSIFLDYRNRADFTDSKVIIYGHNMKDGIMFSNLKKFQDAGFRKEQGRVLLYLPDRVLEYEIVECRKVSVRDSVYEVASEEDKDVLEKVILSTCSVSANNRLIVICKIKP